MSKNAQILYNMGLNDLKKTGENDSFKLYVHRVPGGWNFIYKVYEEIINPDINSDENEEQRLFECYVTSQFVPFNDEFLPKEEITNQKINENGNKENDNEKINNSSKDSEQEIPTEKK